MNDETKPGPPLTALVGPTASGKSALALKVAQLLQAEIISADSAQVYRQLDIGTAKPAPREQALVPHHLIDMVEPDRDFSVADYQKAAHRVIAEVLARGRLPFLVGGTGLYIKAVTDRYAFGDRGKNEALREQLARLGEEQGHGFLYQRLAELDPEAASKIHPRDSRRIIRALEVYILEERPISRQTAETAKRKPAYNLFIFGLAMPRPLLYRRIDERVDAMLEQGFLEEVRGLLRMGYGPEAPGLQILGYRQLAGYLRGESGWEETVAEIKKQTRRLAKRQLTWFRRDKRITWLEAGEEGDDLPAEIISTRMKEIFPPQANKMS